MVGLFPFVQSPDGVTIGGERSISLHRFKWRVWRRGAIALTTLLLTLFLQSCATTTTSQYDATAFVTYVWQVDYTTTEGGGGERPPRLERFASASLVNVNGQRPDDAVTGPDDRGLWYPALPPRPTVDELEAKQRPNEQIGTPQLITEVKYSLTFEKEGQPVTLPTDYSVYRQVARTYPDKPPLELTLGVNESSVEKAEPQ